jgi:hypothetical protein
LMSRPFEAVVYLRLKWEKKDGRVVVLASGQIEGMLRMNNQTILWRRISFVCTQKILPRPVWSPLAHNLQPPQGKFYFLP